MDTEALTIEISSVLPLVKPERLEIESETYNSLREEESSSGDSQSINCRLKSVKKNCQIMKQNPGRIPISTILKNQNPNKKLGAIPEVHITPQELLLKLKLNEAKRKQNSCSCLIF
ncbi:hypothetical protein SteCoe_31347 [Stentor coeruleus]|uniref:Uncharacterized protein n=1 Tax=Stentor coeruleus TaxID=5963 RepID=A0A1R2B1K2_9CILI|nr:hypothetical protein SteCoe_31347 [Stentor coeruleus]